jgi:hypothetical protein
VQLLTRSNNKRRSLEFLGFSNYIVTSDGRVINRNGKVLKLVGGHKKGYLKVTLYSDKVKRNYFIHQLVALAFIPNPHSYDTVDHIDNDTSNNDSSNLQWLPNKVNASKGWEVGNHDSQKKRVLQMTDDKSVVNEYESVAQASREFGVHFSNISRACKTGRKCKGYYWSFE